MFVYVIVNHETLKIYIGKTIRRNLKLYFQKKLWDAEHPESCKGRSHLFNAIRRYGREKFSIHPLMQHSTNDDLCYWERFYIRALNTQHPNVGYNICAGGEGRAGPGYWRGKKRPQETKDKIKVARTGTAVANSGSFKPGLVPWNKGTRGVQISGKKGKKAQYTSDESRQRSLIGLRQGTPKGTKFSKQHRAALSVSHKKPEVIAKTLRSRAANKKVSDNLLQF